MAFNGKALLYLVRVVIEGIKKLEIYLPIGPYYILGCAMAGRLRIEAKPTAEAPNASLAFPPAQIVLVVGKDSRIITRLVLTSHGKNALRCTTLFTPSTLPINLSCVWGKTLTKCSVCYVCKRPEGQICIWLVVIPVDPMESVDLELTFLVSASQIGVTASRVETPLARWFCTSSLETVTRAHGPADVLTLG